MKKYLKSMLLLLLVLAVPLAAVDVYQIHLMNVQTQTGEDERVENPVLVDVDSLKEYGLDPFESNLPVLMLSTDGQTIQKDVKSWVEIAIFDDASGSNDIMGDPTTVLTATCKFRGASSYSNFDKPQYRIEFFKSKGGSPQNYSLFGMASDSEWVLNGPFLDQTLLRNYLIYTLAGETMSWAPSCRFFEMFVDGVYQGVYVAIEPVTDGAERLDLGQFGLVSGATPYVVKRDRVGTEENPIQTYGSKNGKTLNELSVSYPSRKSLTRRQLEWIERDISSFEEVLYSDDFASPTLGYQNYIDVDSFVDYFIYNEFSMNYDAGNLSTYIYKDFDGKLQLCVWDFNNAFDNFQFRPLSTDEFYLVESDWFDRLVQDRSFVERVVERYLDLRKSTLSDSHIMSVLTDGRSFLGNAIDRNFAVWGYTFSSTLRLDGEGRSRNPKSYNEAFEMLVRTISDRLDFMDQSMEELYSYCKN